jgi:hypothetical protein
MAANGSDPSSRCDDAQFARALLECGRASLDSPDLLEPSDLIDRVTVVAERLSDHALIEAAREVSATLNKARVWPVLVDERDRGNRISG